MPPVQTPSPEQQVAECVRKLKHLNRTARKERSSANRAKFNVAVYRYARRFSRSSDKRGIARALGLSPKVSAEEFIDELFRVCARRDDRRLRYKHRTALKLAVMYDEHPSRVMTTIIEAGGYNKAAESVVIRNRVMAPRDADCE